MSTPRTCGASSRSRSSVLVVPGMAVSASRSDDAYVGAGLRGRLVQDRPYLRRLEDGRRQLGGDLECPLLAVHVEQVPARQVLLGLQVGTVGHGRLAVLDAHQLGGGGVGHAVGAEQFPGVVELLVERVEGREEPLLFVRLDRVPQLLVAVDNEHVLHGGAPVLMVSRGRPARAALTDWYGAVP